MASWLVITASYTWGPPHEANNNNSPESTLYLKYKQENGNHGH